MTSSAMTKRGGSRLHSVLLAVPGLLVLFAAAARGEVTRDVYAVAPGDTISVSVLGREDLSCQVRVPREGNVMLPGAGVVRVTGRGVEELSARVATLLEANERLLKARVVVSVISYGVRRAFVYGATAGARAVDLPAEADITLTQAELRRLRARRGPRARPDHQEKAGRGGARHRGRREHHSRGPDPRARPVPRARRHGLRPAAAARLPPGPGPEAGRTPAALRVPAHRTRGTAASS